MDGKDLTDVGVAEVQAVEAAADLYTRMDLAHGGSTVAAMARGSLGWAIELLDRPMTVPIREPQDGEWAVQIVATPSALAFVDVPALEARTGRPVRSRHRAPDEPKPPRADAIIVAPATYNTVNKFARGVADTYALGQLAEAPGWASPWSWCRS
ncbi:flavoprotein [Streptosporangium sp. NPDC006007]|uniref:flavoprotein n=1 Tax=Streptosporangium sp. NPDC006007 TaxID=3154575 RepID=UPI0033B5530B